MKKTALIACAIGGSLLASTAFAQIPSIADPDGGYVKFTATPTNAAPGTKQGLSAADVIPVGEQESFYHYAIKFDQLVQPGDNTDIEMWVGLGFATNGNETTDPSKGSGVMCRYDSNSDTDPATEDVNSIGFGFAWGSGLSYDFQVDTWYNVLFRVTSWNTPANEYTYDLMVWEAGTTQPASWDASSLSGRLPSWMGTDGRGLTLVGQEFTSGFGDLTNISYDNVGVISLSGSRATYLADFNTGLGDFSGGAGFVHVPDTSVQDWMMF